MKEVSATRFFVMSSEVETSLAVDKGATLPKKQ